MNLKTVFTEQNLHNISAIISDTNRGLTKSELEGHLREDYFDTIFKSPKGLVERIREISDLNCDRNELSYKFIRNSILTAQSKVYTAVNSAIK